MFEIVLTGVIVAILVIAYLYFRRFDRYSPADWGSPFKNRLAGMIYCFTHSYHGFTYTPLPLPQHGGAVVASNHVSGLDPLLLIAASHRPLRFLIAREQYNRFGLRWIFRKAGCIPVERDKRPELAMRAALRALAEGDVVALFPHGKIHLDSDPPVKIKGGAIRLAQISGCPVFPARIKGVRGQGHTLLAVFIKSNVDLVAYPPCYCEPGRYTQNLEKLQRLLDQTSSV